VLVIHVLILVTAIQRQNLLQNIVADSRR